MENVQYFVEHNLPSQRDADYVIEKIKNRITWKDNCSILDIGCGPGQVTYNVLLPIIPKNANRIIAIDKQIKVIEYAKQHFGTKSNIIFKQINITYDKDLLLEYAETFDHIFSFYCFHFIAEHDIALRNVFDMLKPGGDFFFTCVAHCNIFNMYEYLSSAEKWKPYLWNCSKLVSSYQNSHDPKKDLEKFLLESGFDILHFDMEPRHLKFNLKYAIDYFVSHSPFDIPKNLKKDFGLACLKMARDMNWTCFDNDKEEVFPLHYKMLFVHVKKL